MSRYYPTGEPHVRTQSGLGILPEPPDHRRRIVHLRLFRRRRDRCNSTSTTRRKKAHVTYYEDDGETYDCEKDGCFRRRIALRGGSLILEKATGSYPSRFQRLKMYFHGFSCVPRISATINGRKAALRS
jgi:hypothetical protein